MATNLVSTLPHDSADRSRMIQINFEAAKKAKQNSAVESAKDYLRNAWRVFPSTDQLFTTEYRLAFDLLFLLGDCETSCGFSDRALEVSFR